MNIVPILEPRKIPATMGERTEEDGIRQGPGGGDWLLIAACGAALWLVNGVWLISDTRPPVWDMAVHQAYALHYVPGFAALEGLKEGLKAWQFSGNYPPLVHVFIALAFWLFHPDSDVASLANLPATFLLLWSVFELGRYFASSAAARWACVLTLLIPYLIWMSRETILDYWLSAWVAFAWVILLRTRGFESRSWSRVFGLVCGFGLLTKWTFAGFVAGPLLYTAMRNRIWNEKRRLTHAFETLILTATLASVWYLPNIPHLIRYFSENAQIGALEGEPVVFSFQSFIYYLRLLEGYQLYALLFFLLAVGVVFAFSRRVFRDPAFWVVCVGGGWLAMTLLRTKDPRFTIPLLGPLMLVPGAWLAAWGRSLLGRMAQVSLVAALAVQAYAVNFGVSWLPPQVILLSGYQGSLRWDWQLFSQHYFGILGAPRREHWAQSDILARVAEEARLRGSGMSLALVPDLPRFNASNFLLTARLARMPMSISQLKSADGGLSAFAGFDFVVMTEGDQGMSWTTNAAQTLNRFILAEHRIFKLTGIFSLPNGDAARLYFIDRGATAGR